MAFSRITELIGQLAANGMYDVGIAAAQDRGVALGDYIRIPNTAQRGNAISNNAADNCMTEGTEIVVTGGVNDQTEMEGSLNVTARRATMIANVNAASVLAMDIEDDIKPLVLACRVLTVTMGLVELKGEFVMCPEVADTDMADDALDLVAAASEQVNNALLVLVAAGINHWALNHTTGAGSLQGAMLKVCSILGLPYPRGHEVAQVQARNRTTRALYLAAHPSSKRNLIYAIAPERAFASAIYIRGFFAVKIMNVDDFIRQRAGGFPAGTRKIYVAVEGAKRIAAAGLLPFMPMAASLVTLTRRLETAARAGTSAHVGATYYLRSTESRINPVNQSDDLVSSLVTIVGAYLQIAAGGSTLAKSPAFTNAEAEAEASFPAWVAEVRAYVTAMAGASVAGLAAVLASSRVYQTANLRTELAAYQAEEDEAAKATLATNIATRAYDTSATMMPRIPLAVLDVDGELVYEANVALA